MGAGDAHTTGGAKDITLRDVIIHMEYMEQRLSADIKTNTKGIAEVDKRLTALDQRLTARIDMLETNLTASMNALEEDLTATMKDTLKIRRHVGMVSTEDM